MTGRRNPKGARRDVQSVPPAGAAQLSVGATRPSIVHRGGHLPREIT
jgi:hypothetical protein